MSCVRIGVAALVGAVVATGPAAASPRAPVNAVRDALRASTVPVLLPQPLPRVFGAVRSISVISAGASGYYVGFSPLVRCAGALSCAFFHVAGSPAAAAGDRPGPHDRRIRLPDGTRAVFRPADCSGASCMEAALMFARGGAVYELDAKVAGDSLRALEGAYGHLRLMR